MKYRFILLVSLLWAVTACSPSNTPTDVVDLKADYSLNARTGIADVDAVLGALETGDPEDLHTLVQYTSAPCTTVEGLGGPPKCRAGETEGTTFNVLPFLGSEGSFIRQEEIGTWQGVDAAGLYAIYRVSESGRTEEYYPRGDYAVILKTVDGSVISLRIANGGIVRVDSLFFNVTQDSLESLVKQDSSEVILAP